MISRILDFLFSLDRVHFTSNTRFSFIWGPTLLLLAGAVVLAVIGYMFYWPQSASPNKKKAMGIVRGLLLALVFLLAWRPQLVMEHEDQVKSVVAVWVDNSGSMSLEDPYTGTKVDTAMAEYVHKMGDELKAGANGGDAAHGRINRYDLAMGTLANAKWLKELTETQEIIFFTGAGHAQSIGIASSPAQVDTYLDLLKKTKPAGETTDVPTVVREIIDQAQGRRLSGIVLLTDGQTTEKGSRLDQSATLAQMANAKVFAVPYGQEEEPFNLKMTTMRVPESTFVKDPVSARIHIAGAGIVQPTTVRINIFRKPPGTAGTRPAAGVDLGLPLATKEVTLTREQMEQDVEVPVKLEKKAAGKFEEFDLIARVEPAAMGGPSELWLDDNEKARTIKVRDAQINVLYVEGYPRWEFRYLKNELIREPTVNLSTLLQSADEGFTQDADPQLLDKATSEELFPGPLLHFPDTKQDLNKYDVLLIGDIEPTYFSPSQQKLIIEWVKTRGGGVAWIAGSAFNPEAYRESELEVLLPIAPDEIDPRARVMAPSNNEPYNLQLTPAGKETNLFRFFEESEKSWKQVADLPEMYWFKPVQGLKPGAVVLATHPKRSLNGNPAPLLVMRQYGAGPVLFSAFCDTWRWRKYDGEPLFQSYWLQMCRLLNSNALGASKRLELAAENARVEIGEPIKVRLTVKDQTLVGQMPSEVPVMVVNSEGRTVDTVTLMRAASAGGAVADPSALERMEGAVTAAQLGKFTLTIKPGTLPMDVAGAEIEVDRPRREFETVVSDVQSLTSISVKSGGKVVPPYRSEELPKLIPDRSMPILNTQSEELWNKPIALFLVLLLATTEWLIRKSAGLI